MNNALMFSKASDEWSTPQSLFDSLNAEFKFTLDAAATRENAKCAAWLGPGGLFPDALDPEVVWGKDARVWLNPPYSRCFDFIERAAYQAKAWGGIVVCLVPSRTDTRWFHEHVWDAGVSMPRERVEIRFLKGRVKFGEGKNSAPFPSVVIIFRGQR